jgi:Fuc2NAc and GlcNAc transferase
MGFARVPVGSLGSLLAVVGIVWSINLFNFMDGIDGLAGSEAIAAVLFGAALAWETDPATASACLLLAASVGGFLLLNRPPARIFMGDVGSCWLGYVLAVLILASNGTGSVPMTSWFLLLSVFIVDATVTLIARVITGNSPVEPHREHAYQRLVRSGLSHGSVTGAVLGIDLLLGGTTLVLRHRPGLLAASVILAWIALFEAWRRTRRLPEAPADPPPLRDSAPNATERPERTSR